jgi:predicted Zn-dependent protease with MMP-like domain
VTFEQFEAAAREAFASIPADYHEGVDGIEVSRSIVPHPSLPDVFTLGECRSEHYPSEFGGPGDVSSIVVLYYGSFLEISRRSDDWDWEDEIFETVTHEVRHHLESLAADDSLEVQDYAEDQNFARREGEPFNPFFYRSGFVLAPGIFEIDGDVFVERRMSDGQFAAAEQISWGMPDGSRMTALAPSEMGDVHFVRSSSPSDLGDVRATDGAAGTAPAPAPGEDEGGRGVYLVLVRRRGVLASIRGMLSGARLRVMQDGVDQVAHS